MWAELAARDAEALGVGDGDLVRIESRRGEVVARARIGSVRPGVVFVPFHYGYWDVPDRPHSRAANEMTMTAWDPVSKQPLFKVAAVAVSRVAGGEG
ncbi:MAG TPA: molybdopterin dinucleotide binding domain-containing protein [Asanoa sp.]